MGDEGGVHAASGLIIQELRAIYFPEMTKSLLGIFGKGLPWDIQKWVSQAWRAVGLDFINAFCSKIDFSFFPKIVG